MELMFWGAISFNSTLRDWNVNKVTDIAAMFIGAESFDQDLGWCVDEDVDLYDAFEDTQCESTSCGVAHGQFKTENGQCDTTPAPTGAPTLAPTGPTPETDAALRGERVAVALVVVCMALLA